MLNKIELTEASRVLKQSAQEFRTVFEHGTLSLELYQPNEIDKQTPHERDEVYLIASGQGKFYLAGEVTNIQTGDFIFVPARAEHRFVQFTEDFSTWVIFYGPPEGEKSIIKNLLADIHTS